MREKIQGNKADVPAIEKLLSFIDLTEDLAKSLRDVHNFAVHFSTEDITNELKNKLYCLSELSNILAGKYF